MRAAGEERSIVIESDLYRVEISNRGAVVRSWQLKKFTDDNTPPRTLDLVHAEAAQQSGSWPFSLALDDPEQESAVNNALFEITSRGNSAASRNRAPRSRGHHAGLERRAPRSHQAFEIQRQLHRRPWKRRRVWTGSRCGAGIAWAGGFGDATAYRAALQTQVFDSAAGKFNTLAAKNLGKSGQTTVRATVPGTFDFVGIEDLYFAAAFLPPFTAHGDLAETPITLYGLDSSTHHTNADGKTETESVPQMAAGIAAPGPLDLRDVRWSKEH